MADQKIASVRAKLQATSADFQKLEGSMSRAIEARQRLDSQLQENEQVLKEFALLKDHNTVYKLTGPALVPHDAAEAKSNVEKRLGFIKTEITRVEAQIKDHEEKVSKKRSEVVQLQQEFQALQAPSAQAA